MRVRQINMIDDFKQFVDDIMNEAINVWASDIHVEPQKDEVQLRYRIDWEIYKTYSINVENKNNLIARIKILAQLKIDETRRPQDGQIVHSYLNPNTQETEDIDVRISTFPTVFGEKIVLRILRKDENLLNLNSLGFMQYNLKLIKQALSLKEGLILVSWGTWSGKTTTLYSMLNSFTRESYNISTLEDPIEYKLPGINQSQVKPEIDYTFSTGLKTLLRQDPDVILVGEIRDRETAKLAIDASMTGHLVLWTIHSNKWSWAVERLLNMWIEPYLVFSSLKLVISQRLVKKVCPYCGQLRTEISEEDENLFKDWLWPIWDSIKSSLNLKKPVGCHNCLNLWFSWRMWIHEVIMLDNDFRRVIKEDMDSVEWDYMCQHKGYLSLYQDALIKAAYWFIDLGHALQVK